MERVFSNNTQQQQKGKIMNKEKRILQKIFHQLDIILREDNKNEILKGFGNLSKGYYPLTDLPLTINPDENRSNSSNNQ